MNDYFPEIEREKASLDEAMHDAKALADRLPYGLAKQMALNLVFQLKNASLTISFPRPAVPCRLAFVGVVVPKTQN